MGLSGKICSILCRPTASFRPLILLGDAAVFGKGAIMLSPAQLRLAKRRQAQWQRKQQPFPVLKAQDALAASFFTIVPFFLIYDSELSEIHH
jgi:hypothetical protein